MLTCPVKLYKYDQPVLWKLGKIWIVLAGGCFFLLLHLLTNFVETFQVLESSKLMIVSRDIVTAPVITIISLQFYLNNTFSNSGYF